MTSQQIPALTLNGSRLFAAWLGEQKVSLAFTTYQAGKLFFIGLKPDGSLSVFERTFDRCMGLGVNGRQLWMSSLYQLWRFEDFLDPGPQKVDYDAVFVPVTGHTTGDIDIHDIHTGPDGQPIFVVTRFNCLATLSERGSFRPIWQPPFIDRIAAEDRCHLNGLAVHPDGTPAYVTCVGPSNVTEGWREHRREGGIIIDVASNETVATGLSMPHSPRLYQDKLWVLQAGTGEFGWVNPTTGDFTALCFLPGFARGLSFIGDYAVIGLSRPRMNRTFEGLALNERLKASGVGPKCGLAVVNLITGDVEHLLEIDGVVQELYDVVTLPEVIRPKALGFRSKEIRFTIRPESDDTS